MSSDQAAPAGPGVDPRRGQEEPAGSLQRNTLHLPAQTLINLSAGRSAPLWPLVGQPGEGGMVPAAALLLPAGTALSSPLGRRAPHTGRQGGGGGGGGGGGCKGK